MTTQEYILKLLEAGRTIRMLDGRWTAGFVDTVTLSEMAANGTFNVIERQGMKFATLEKQP